MGNFINKLTDKNFNILEHLNDLNLGYKDKVVIILGETGVGKTTFINEITGRIEKDKNKESSDSISCTKGIEFTKYFYDGYNYFFVDTPGLNDAGGDIKNIEEIKKIKPGIISTVILVRNYTTFRLTNSYKNALVEFMKIFPSENFFEHIILLETFYSEQFRLEKETLIQSISKNDDLLSFINEHNIKLPDNISTFQIDLKSTQDHRASIFSEILKKIRNMHPFFKTYNEEEKNYIKEEREGFQTYIYYEFNKIITYTDFNGVENTKIEKIESGRYLETEKRPNYIIVEREKTNEMRQPFWMIRWLPCFHDEYRIIYYTIKIYDINGHIYKLRDFYQQTWENDDNEGEAFRRNIESELSGNIDRKLLNRNNN